MTKIEIISGFLGAGKTTLIKKLIEEAYKGEKLVLIENEFGEIGIDGGFLKDAGVEINEMNSGCICCSLVGDFGTALQEVLDKFHPDRIIIEPSGVGKLSDVIKAVEGVAEGKDVVLNSYTAVVDGKKTKMYMKNFGEFFNNQVEYAKTIIISRSQDMTEDKLNECVHLLKEHNDKAVLITTPWDDIDGKKILEAMENSASLELEIMEEHEHHHHHDGECCHHDHDHHHDHEHHHDEECCHHDHEHEHHHHDGECCHHDHEHDHHHHEHDEHCTCGCHDHHHHHADEVFTSWGTETHKKFTMDFVRGCLEELDKGTYGMVLRAKGILAAEDGSWIHFDFVPGEMDLRAGGSDTTGKLCVIGSKLDEHGIQHLFGL